MGNTAFGFGCRSFRSVGYYLDQEVIVVIYSSFVCVCLPWLESRDKAARFPLAATRQ